MRASSNLAHVEYAPGWTAPGVAGRVYRERAYDPPFDDLPWGETAESLSSSGRRRQNLAKTSPPAFHPGNSWEMRHIATSTQDKGKKGYAALMAAQRNLRAAGHLEAQSVPGTRRQGLVELQSGYRPNLRG